MTLEVMPGDRQTARVPCGCRCRCGASRIAGEDACVLCLAELHHRCSRACRERWAGTLHIAERRACGGGRWAKRAAAA